MEGFWGHLTESIHTFKMGRSCAFDGWSGRGSRFEPAKMSKVAPIDSDYRTRVESGWSGSYILRVSVLSSVTATQ